MAGHPLDMFFSVRLRLCLVLPSKKKPPEGGLKSGISGSGCLCRDTKGICNVLEVHGHFQLLTPC